MLITIASFLAMAVAVRELGTRMTVYEILFFRALIAFFTVLPIVLIKNPGAMRTDRIGLHLARNFVHYGGQFGWTAALGMLTMAEVFALEFTTPLWVALIAIFILREPFSTHRLVATVGGFIGVMMIVRPTSGVLEPGAVYILCAAFCYACSICMVKLLTRTDSALTVVFYMGLIQTPLSLLPAIPGWQAPLAAEWPWLIVTGVGTLCAHYAMTRALTIADATLIFPMDFLRMPGVAVIAWLLYDESVGFWVGAGAAVIFISNYYNVRVESRLHSGHQQPRQR